jgi:hypothetical protein
VKGKQPVRNRRFEVGMRCGIIGVYASVLCFLALSEEFSCHVFCRLFFSIFWVDGIYPGCDHGLFSFISLHFSAGLFRLFSQRRRLAAPLSCHKTNTPLGFVPVVF